MTSTEPLLNRLILERLKFEKEAKMVRLRAVNAYQRWSQSRTNQELLSLFFEHHYHAMELTTRIEWLDGLIDEYLP